MQMERRCKVHGKLRATPFQANRMLAVVGSMYAFAARIGAVPEGTNPASGKSCICGGRTSILSVVCCSFPIAKAAERR